MSLNKSEGYIKRIIENYNFNNYNKPSKFIKDSWEFYQENDDFEKHNTTNGLVFEGLVAYILAYEKIENIYEQAEVAFVPNAIFDLLLYHPRNTYTLSLKTTLRERWKQADLEAFALKNVLTESRSYLITLSESEVATRRAMLKKGKDHYNGLDKFVLAQTSEFDDLIEELNQYTFIPGEKISIITNEDKYTNLDVLNMKFELDTNT